MNEIVGNTEASRPGRPAAAAPRRRQSGVAMLKTFFLLGVGVLIGVFTFRLLPQYYEFWTVREVAREAAARPELLAGSREKILHYIDEGYRRNNLWDLKAADTVVLTKGKRGGYSLKVQYERRAPLFYNIDVVTAFDEDVAAD